MREYLPLIIIFGILIATPFLVKLEVTGGVYKEVPIKEDILSDSEIIKKIENFQRESKELSSVISSRINSLSKEDIKGAVKSTLEMYRLNFSEIRELENQENYEFIVLGKNFTLLVDVPKDNIKRGSVYALLFNKYEEGREYSKEEILNAIEESLNKSIGENYTIDNVLETDDGYQIIFSYKNKKGYIIVYKDGRVPIGEISIMYPLEYFKLDKPYVKLFVMSYCPYGLQTIKALLPVVDLLKDKVEFQLHFVSYTMHGDKERIENERQYCIQALYGDKIWDYLKCFVKAGESEKCLKEIGVRKENVERCMKILEERYNVSGTSFAPELEENMKYSVMGSPTLVINDYVVEFFNRSPEGIKEAICSFFLEPPKECSENLSNKIASPGFGYSEGGTSTGRC